MSQQFDVVVIGGGPVVMKRRFVPLNWFKSCLYRKTYSQRQAIFRWYMLKRGLYSF